MMHQYPTATQVPQSSPRYALRFWSSIQPQVIPADLRVGCPECGQEMPEGECYNLACTLGLHSVQEAVHRDMPEDWPMVETASVHSSKEAAPAASPSPVPAEVAA